MFRKTVLFICTFMLCFGVLWLSWGNYETKAKASTGTVSESKVTYSFDKKTGILTISGKGDMPADMQFRDNQKIKKVIVPEIYSAEHYSSVNRLKEFWELVINRRQEIYHTNSNLILPSFIKDKMDFDVIEVMDSRANFITDKIATGEVCFLGEETKDVNIFNKIIVIEKADPGFDWIFSKGITGLITKYGGAASHMAIRCAEFKVAAAIGCGSTLFEYACNSHTLTIDCKHEKLIRKD